MSDDFCSLQAGRFAQASGPTKHILFGPEHYEPKYAYPLLVWLHGSGDDHRQLLRVMPLVSLRNYVAVAPEGLLCEGGRSGGKFEWPQTQAGIEQAEFRVFEAVDAACRKYRVAANRVFLAGFDAGGSMALRVALGHPEYFAGAASLCGRFPQGLRPLSRLEKIRCLPVLLSFARHSSRYGPAEACDDLRLLHAAGVWVTLRQYPGGHQLGEQMLKDLNRWIMEQIETAATDQTSSSRPESNQVR